jgi:hypothetical protein
MRTNSIILDSFNGILVEKFYIFLIGLKEGLLGDEGILNGNFDEFLWVLFLNF